MAEVWQLHCPVSVAPLFSGLCASMHAFLRVPVLISSVQMRHEHGIVMLGSSDKSDACFRVAAHAWLVGRRAGDIARLGA